MLNLLEKPSNRFKKKENKEIVYPKQDNQRVNSKKPRTEIRVKAWRDESRKGEGSMGEERETSVILRTIKIF